MSDKAKDIRNPIGLYTAHILVSLIFLLTLSVLYYIMKDRIADALLNMPEGLLNGLTRQEYLYGVLLVAFSFIVVLMTFIFYLLLTFRSRNEYYLWTRTKELAISNQQFKRLYESAPVPYIMLDKDGNIYEPNKSALRFFSAFPEQIEGKNLFSYLGGDSQDKIEELSLQYRNRIPINRRESQFITTKGEIRSVLLTIYDMHGSGNTSRMGLVVIFDITEQKQIEKTKTEFLSLASHQLRTPLVTTRWYAEALVSGDLGQVNDGQRKYLEVIHNVNQDMIELVDVLLNTSRIEMGSLKMEKVKTNIESIVDSIYTELSMQIKEKKINFIKKSNGLFTDIETDPKLLRVIIQNLVSNAVKYTPNGGTITVDFDKKGAERRISISDTGYGIPKNQQDKIFTKLFRADNVKNLQSSQGTGLGLYLVKSIAVSMGGNIKFVSEENKGSTFTLFF